MVGDRLKKTVDASTTRTLSSASFWQRERRTVMKGRKQAVEAKPLLVSSPVTDYSTTLNLEGDKKLSRSYTYKIKVLEQGTDNSDGVPKTLARKAWFSQLRFLTVRYATLRYVIKAYVQDIGTSVVHINRGY